MPLLTADLDWNVLTWIEFVRGATAYRDHFSRQAREDAAYLACYRALRREDSMLARVGRSREIVTFLNAWACRLDSKKAPAVFRGWIYAHGSELEELGLVALTDRDVPSLSREVDGLYDSVIALRSELHNMSDAAASKVLHQLVPDLFVMWDKTIKQVAMMQGYGRYSGFLVAMHELSRRLLDQADMTRDEAEVYLQRELGYSTRKTFAKYVDEANWYWTVGRYSALRGAQ
ncbi:MAG: hypothetical protein E6G10_08855 [Actinobacteria bacterium]|nr:MAG: hypothetical protein E6G10_08855 [Actinomycetota bacterium]